MGLCKRPFYSRGIIGHGCGQCTPCKIKKRRECTHRILLERFTHGDAAFVTCTYRYVTYGGLDVNSATLDYRHHTLFLKRLREKFKSPIRYFAIGEYGENSQRPHFHYILFGYPTCVYGRSQYSKTRKNCCGPCDLIRDTWKLGNVDLGSVTAQSAGYVAKYQVKSLTNKNNDRVLKKLNGRMPERAWWSKRPGIGANAIPDIAKILTTDVGAESILRNGDVPLSLHHGGKSMPLGRYLRRKLREHLGFKNVDAQDGWALKASEEVCKVYEKAFSETDDAKAAMQKVLEQKKQKILNCETRYKLFSKKGGL